MSKSTLTVLRAVVALGLLLSWSRAVEAGPPLICHPFETGGAALLPWGTGPGWNTPDRSYDVRRLTVDTMRLLSADTPVLARMETLRRATIYAAEDPRVAAELLAAVLGRAQAAKPQGSRDPLAWFDAGYLLESYRQARSVARRDMLSADAPDGYAFVRKAIELAGSNPEMEFAASLMKEGAASAEHRHRAEAGAKVGSLLAKNLAR